MARYKSKNENQYEKLIKEGLGQGTKENYKPWLTIRDVPSKGLSTRINGWRTGRVHHFLSLIELSYFYILEWSTSVTDIREQYPLNLEDTIEISERLGIQHPKVPNSEERTVMTTDFLIDTKDLKLFARSIKPYSELSSKRTIEKIMIEKTYWEEKGIDFKVVTQREIPTTLSKNVEFIYMAKCLEEFPGMTENTLFQLEPYLFEKLNDNHLPLAKAALEFDQEVGIKPGTSLWVIKYLLANRIWKTNMDELIDTSMSIHFIKSNNVKDKEL